MLLLAPGASTASPLFENEAVLSSDTGYVSLNWSNPDHQKIELQQANSPDFENAQTLYEGKNKSLFVSGLRDGTYYFRLCDQQGTWSAPVKLHVKHHAIEKAWALFALGALVFLSIIFVIIRGAKEHE